MQRFTTFRLAAATAGLTVLLAGCANDDAIDFGNEPHKGSPSTAASSTSIANTTAAELAKVTDAYTTYWQTYDAQAAQPSSDRAAVTATMQTVAVDPTLTVAVDGIVNAALVGQVGYGSNVLHPETPVFQNSAETEAIITDCVDSSQNGWQDATGKKLTVGSAANSLTATVVRGEDGVWRVSNTTLDERVTCSA